MFPNYKEKGLSSISGTLVMFTSDQVSSKIYQFQILFETPTKIMHS